MDDELNDLLASTDPYTAMERVDILIARASLDDAASLAATQALQVKAVLLSRIDNDEASALLWQQVRRQWLVLEGDDSRQAAEAQRQHAMTLYWSGDPVRADAEMTAYRAKATLIWGPASDEMLQAMRFHVGIIAQLGREDEAIELQRTILARALQEFGPDDARVLLFRKDLAVITRTHSGPEDALAQLEALLPNTERVRGAWHSEALDVREEIAFTLGRLERAEEADAAYRSLIDVLIAGDDAVALRTAFQRRIRIHELNQDDARLDAALLDATNTLSAVLGETHPTARELRKSWAYRLAETRREDQAIAQYEVISQAMGDEGDDASIDAHVIAEHAIAVLERGLGRVEQSLARLRRALTFDTPPASKYVLRQAMAMALTDLERGDEAIAIMQDLAATGTLSARNDLAVAYIRDNRYREALMVLEAMRDEATEVGGPIALRVLGNIALASCELGQHESALTRWAELLEAQRTEFEPDDADVLRTRHNLAREYHHLRDYSRSIAAYDLVIADRERVLGPENPLTLSSQSGRASVALAAGDVADAALRFRNLLDARIRVLGAAHPLTIDTAELLATAEERLGNVDVARALTDSALSALASSEGEDAVSAARGMYRRAELLVERDRPAEALVEFGRAADAFDAALSPAHPDAVRARLGAADSMYFLGRPAEAVSAYRSVRGFVPALNDARRHAQTLDRLSGALMKTASPGYGAPDGPDVEEALALQQEAIVIASAGAGADDPFTLNLRSRLGRRLALAKRHESAEEVYRSVAADRSRVLGPEHRDTLDSRSDIAETLLARGKNLKATREFNKLLPTMRRVTGADSADTRRAEKMHARAAKLAAQGIVRIVLVVLFSSAALAWGVSEVL